MKTLTLILACISFNLFAFADQDWVIHWVSGLESIENNDFVKALKDLNHAVELMEATSDIDHAHVYITRAELNLRTQNLSLGLEDLDKALNSSELTNSERYKASLMRIYVKSQMENFELDDNDIDIQYIIASNETRIEQTNDLMIIRNLPDDASLRETLSYWFIDSGIIDNPSDVKFLKSGTCIIKKCSVCHKEESHCNFCKTARQQQPKVEQRTIDGCKIWCDTHAVISQGWCAKAFSRSPTCLTLCLGSVHALQKTCHWCCSDGAFYEKCVAPFADIISKIPSRCEPEWD